ncbi:hypothetical protein GNP92_02495 [Paenibacillus timonensis]|nr:hypothetical protein [Paenibacillus timonensis]MUG85220.1 hypothetical protein [Paenibacillus timonensis]
MNNRGLTVRQFALWMAMYQIGSAYLLIPSGLATVAGHDAWLCVVVPVISWYERSRSAIFFNDSRL